MNGRFGLGCADLLRLSSARDRRHLLEAGLEAGIRHYDVAPMYGLGLAEREVGRFAQGRRDKIVIATKFGITPTRSARLLAPVQAPLQRLAGLRRPRDPRLGASGSALYHTSYDVASARRSLEDSLHALHTDYVDFLFVHDPPAGTVLPDELIEYLEAAKTEGTIRAWGVAGADAASVGAHAPVVQLPGDAFSRTKPNPAQTTIFYGVIRRALPRVLSHIFAHPSRRRRWSDKVGADCGDPSVLARLLLHEAADATRSGLVLVSTTHADRIAPLVAPTGVAAFRKLLAEVE